MTSEPGPHERELPQAVSAGAADSQPAAVRRQKPPDFKGIREKFPSAYSEWSPEDDLTLLREHHNGVSIAEIARQFERPPSAVRSRLRKLQN